jgi:hypothetical protein
MFSAWLNQVKSPFVWLQSQSSYIYNIYIICSLQISIPVVFPLRHLSSRKFFRKRSPKTLTTRWAQIDDRKFHQEWRFKHQGDDGKGINTWGAGAGYILTIFDIYSPGDSPCVLCRKPLIFLLCVCDAKVQSQKDEIPVEHPNRNILYPLVN